MDWDNFSNQEFYSWDYHKNVIEKGDYHYYQVKYKSVLESYFIINLTNGTIAQFNTLKNTQESLERLFIGIKRVADSVKVNNVDECLIHKIDYINSIGLKNTVNQYEMELNI